MSDLIPKEVWASRDKASAWIDRAEKIKNSIPEDVNTDIQSIHSFIDDVRKCDFKSFLEVGAGNGRLIGSLSKKLRKREFASIDINPYLSEYVSTKYQRVDSYVGDVIKLPFDNDTFDLVYTYQVLQHVPPSDVNTALHEMIRVCKKEVWIMEGHDPEYSHCMNGFMRKGTDGGTFVYRFDEMVSCYETSIPSSEKLKDMGVKLYKIKKYA